MGPPSSPVRLDELVQLSNSGPRPTSPMSAPTTTRPPTLRPLDPLVADANGVVYGRRAHPSGGRRLPIADVPRRVERAAVHRRQRPPDAPPRHRHRRLAGRVGPGARGLGTRRCTGGVRRRGLRVLLLVRARRAVRHPGDGEQHPGGDPGVRPRDPVVWGRRRPSCSTAPTSGSPPACSPPRASSRSSGTHPPPRSAGAERRWWPARRPAPGVGSHRPGRPVAAGRWQTRDAGRSIVIGLVLMLIVAGIIEGFVTGSSPRRSCGSASGSLSRRRSSPGSWCKAARAKRAGSPGSSANDPALG